MPEAAFTTPTEKAGGWQHPDGQRGPGELSTPSPWPLTGGGPSFRSPYACYLRGAGPIPDVTDAGNGQPTPWSLDLPLDPAVPGPKAARWR